jgi:hypothetical protein
MISSNGAMTAGPTAVDGSKLISVDKPSSQSSEAYGGLAWYGNDGNTDGNWTRKSVTCTKEEEKPWWKVDLIGGHEVKKVVVWNRIDCCGDRLNGFDVLVDDEICGSVTTAQDANTVYCSNKVGYTVTVQLQKRGMLSLAEVQVYGFRVVAPVKKPAECIAPAAPLNLKNFTETTNPATYEPFMTTECSGNNAPPRGNPRRAVDGNKNAHWGSGTDSCTFTGDCGFKPWWEVDLGKSYEISKVVIYNRNDCCADQNNGLEVLIDGKLAGTLRSATLPSNTIDLNCVRGQKLRVQAPRTGSLTLCEVEIYGEVDDPVAKIKAAKAAAKQASSPRRSSPV